MHATPSLEDIDPGKDRSLFVEILRERVLDHLEALGLGERVPRSMRVPLREKNAIRTLHATHRRDVLALETPALAGHVPRLLSWFAEGNEIRPENIRPELVLVKADTDYALLFRLATMLWSVPVSRGYGRRLRFLVIDEQNQKLLGLFALGDPVFNMRVRDDWIGWTSREREERLVNVMDAFVVGAVPPYNQLLGGKLVASLIASQEVAHEFDLRYGRLAGTISGRVKEAHLALVSITSALGRSSLYNRVKLPGLVELTRIGATEGWGHFHVPAALFQDMRRLLAADGHHYASGYRYGDGPNWRIRVIREALTRIGLDGDLLRHGISREVYAMPLLKNWREYLLGESDLELAARPSATEIGKAAISRWIVPRAARMPDFRSWRREHTAALLPGRETTSQELHTSCIPSKGDWPKLTVWKKDTFPVALVPENRRSRTQG